jgi:hypothetical protein
MAVNFPTSLDILQNPTATDYLNSPSHAGQHANANDILEALEAKVGINSSAVTTSHDYKLSNIIGSQKAASEDYVNNNRKIVPSVSGNNLTVALKTLAGNDPSVSDPAYIRIGDIIRIITYPVSFTVNAGQNYLNMGSSELATKTVGLFPKLVWNTNTGAVSLIASRIPFGNIISEYTDSLTGEKGYLYSGTKPASTDIVENIGYFEATLSAGAGYTWTVPTFTSTNLIQRPIFETRLLEYVPTVYSWTNAPTSQTLTGYYSLCGSDCIIYGQISGTANGSNSSALLILLIPFLAKTVGGSGGKSTCIGNAQWTDNTTFDEMATIRTDVSTTERRVSYQFPTATRKPVALYFSAMFKI